MTAPELQPGVNWSGSTLIEQTQEQAVQSENMDWIDDMQHYLEHALEPLLGAVDVANAVPATGRTGLSIPDSGRMIIDSAIQPDMGGEDSFLQNGDLISRDPGSAVGTVVNSRWKIELTKGYDSGPRNNSKSTVDLTTANPQQDYLVPSLAEVPAVPTGLVTIANPPLRIFQSGGTPLEENSPASLQRQSCCCSILSTETRILQRAQWTF